MTDSPSEDALLLTDPRLKQSTGTLYDQEFWGIPRHELIAGAAETFLSQRARDAVTTLLKPLSKTVRLRNVAGWADRIKRHTPNPAQDDPDTVDFLRDARNKRQPEWHYVNIPLDAEAYDRERYPAFTNDEDVVQMARECIRVLAAGSQRFSALNALRLITHLAGDLHQPVHVGCCYISGSGSHARLERDPEAIVNGNFKSDRGGNALRLPTGDTLHGYWDSKLESPSFAATADAEIVASPELQELFIRKLVAMAVAQASDAQFAPGDVVSLPNAWATASLIAARQAYVSLRIVGPNPSKPKVFDVEWDSRAAYDQRCAPIVKNQLSLAARHLAGLLNAIWN